MSADDFKEPPLPTLRNAILEQLRLAGARMPAVNIRTRIALQGITATMPDVLHELDVLVADGLVEKLTQGEPRALYWLTEMPQVRPAVREPVRPVETEKPSDAAPSAGDAESVIYNALVEKSGRQRDLVQRTGLGPITVQAALAGLLSKGRVIQPRSGLMAWCVADGAAPPKPRQPAPVTIPQSAAEAFGCKHGELEHCPKCTAAVIPIPPSEPLAKLLRAEADGRPGGDCTTKLARTLCRKLENDIDGLIKTFERATGCAVHCTLQVKL